LTGPRKNGKLLFLPHEVGERLDMEFNLLFALCLSAGAVIYHGAFKKEWKKGFGIAGITFVLYTGVCAIF
jgi:hypothetical protein